MNEITLPFRHRIRNSSPDGLRPSSLLLGHGGSPQYWIFTSEHGKKHFVSLKIICVLNRLLGSYHFIFPGGGVEHVFFILGGP